MTGKVDTPQIERVNKGEYQRLAINIMRGRMSIIQRKSLGRKKTPKQKQKK